MLNMIVENANYFISSIADNYLRESYARTTTKNEIQALIGLFYYAGVLKSNHLNDEDLWRTDGSSVEIFRLKYCRCQDLGYF